MTLIKSISGIRGTIGGKPGDNLTPLDVVQFSAAFAQWIKKQSGKNNPKVVLGRDGRISGEMVLDLAAQTLKACGVHVVKLGLSTTPTVEVYVPYCKADGGIILTASHNPKEWNALKLLNNKGEFISGDDGAQILAMIEAEDYDFVSVDELGSIEVSNDSMSYHIDLIKNDALVDADLIASKKYKVVVDGVNSSGSFAIPDTLRALGVAEVIVLNEEITGDFAHNPEPLPENLTELAAKVKEVGADLGIAVDPDVDRLALIDENGNPFGEEYTLVAVADYILQNRKGATVSNLSSSRALADVTNKHGCNYTAAAVGEVNVVTAMKANGAVIGGEGNGGIIYPPLHYGRDAMVGVALFLTYLAQENILVSNLRAKYPDYVMVKSKMPISAGVNVDEVLKKAETAFANENLNTIDGVKVDFEAGWVHLRKSNTEPIIRLYAEAPSEQEALALVEKVKTAIN